MTRNRLKELDLIAQIVHAGQVDQQGAPYIDHLRAVAGTVSSPAKPVALFHDSIEDHQLTADELAHILTPVELAAVQLLTRDPDVSYKAFIRKIANAQGAAGELAREVKIADVHHNLGRLVPHLEHLRRRYERALKILT